MYLYKYSDLHRFVAWLLLSALLGVAQPARASICQVEGVVTHTDNVRDVLATPSSLWIASEGGLSEYDRNSLLLRKTYTHLDGLGSLAVAQISTSEKGEIVAAVDGGECLLSGEKFNCARNSGATLGERLRFEFTNGARITDREQLREGELIGTAGAGALLDGKKLGDRTGLPGPHVTALAVYQGRLWAGTFNAGLAREDKHGMMRPHKSPGQLINALLTGPRHLFVGTSAGLFRTNDGSHFERVKMVEDAVVGLAFDGTSVWATTPGAIYRVRDGNGPPSDVWWLPGGSRSLQKVSAVSGYVWFGTEDRGAIRMRVSSRTVSRDKPFSIFDRTVGMPSSWSLAVAALEGGSGLMTTLREGVALISPRGEGTMMPTGVSAWGLSTLRDKEGVWVGTQGGAVYISLKGEKPATIAGLPDPRVHAFLRDPRPGFEERLYIGTENGLAWCHTKVTGEARSPE